MENRSYFDVGVVVVFQNACMRCLLSHLKNKFFYYGQDTAVAKLLLVISRK